MPDEPADLMSAHICKHTLKRDYDRDGAAVVGRDADLRPGSGRWPRVGGREFLGGEELK